MSSITQKSITLDHENNGLDYWSVTNCWLGWFNQIIAIPLMLWLLHYTNNDSKHVCMNSRGMDILSQVACSSVSKWVSGDMAIGMASQPGWRFGMKQTCSLLLGDSYSGSLWFNWWRLDSKLCSQYWTTCSLVWRQLVIWNACHKLTNNCPDIFW